MHRLISRARNWGRGWDDDSGAVLVVVGVSLIALLGFAAIAIDGGLLFNEKRHSQNAADHAALAAAWAHCQGEDPVAAANSSVVKNNFQTANLTLDTSDAPRYTANVNSTVDLAFAKVIGFSTSDVATSATSECVTTGGGGGGANPTTAIWSMTWVFFKAQESPNIEGMFANGDNCVPISTCTDPRYTWSYNGDPELTQPFHIGSRDDTSTVHDASCTTTGCFTGQEDPFVGGVAEDGTQVSDYPWTTDFNEFVAQFAGPSPTVVDSLSGCPSDGVYVVNGDASIDSGCTRQISIIASGTIIVNANDVDLTAHSNGVLFASFSDAALYNSPQGFAIETNTSESFFTGLIYAPHGTFHEDGDRNVYQGAVVAESVYITDNDGTWLFDDSVFPPSSGGGTSEAILLN